MCYQAKCVDGSKILKNATFKNPCEPNPCQNGVCRRNTTTGLLFCDCQSNIKYAGKEARLNNMY